MCSLFFKGVARLNRDAIVRADTEPVSALIGREIARVKCRGAEFEFVTYSTSLIAFNELVTDLSSSVFLNWGEPLACSENVKSVKSS